MSLELFVSSPGTGKTTACIELFKRWILKSKSGIDSRSYFILPSREHADRIQHLIFKQPLPGLFNAHILTINDFTSRLLGASGGKSPTDALRMRLIQQVLEDPELDFPYFAAVKRLDGFHRLLAESLKEFKASLLGVSEFERRCQSLVKDPAFRMKYRDFCLVLKNYEIRLKALGLAESEDQIAAITEKPRIKKEIDLVIFDGFYHFSKAQMRLVEIVSGHASCAVVSLTLPPKNQDRQDLFFYPEKSRQFLLSIGFKQKQNDFLKNWRTQQKDLTHLEKNIFSDTPEKIASQAIEIFEAPGARAEIEMIAREIKRLCREMDLFYSDISLILRNVSSYEKIIEAVFDDFEIPVSIHERKKMLEHGFSMTLYRFLNLSKDDWKREDLMHVLKSSFMPSHFLKEAVLEIETAARAQNVKDGKISWTPLTDGLSKSAKQILETVMCWEEGLISSKSAVEFKTRLLHILESWNLGEGDDVFNARVQDLLKNILDSLLRYGAGQKEFSASFFLSECQEAFKKALFSMKPTGKNRVQVYDVVMAIPKEYKIVFMAGLLEKTFPQDIGEDALFSDSERQAINQKGYALDERLWRLFGERYFFYMGATRAKTRLYLTYPLYNLEDRPALTSFFIEEVKKCFHSVTVKRRRLSEFLPAPEEWESGKDVSLGIAALAPKKQPAPALIRDPEIKKIFGGLNGAWSPTRLETFATCAFKYFCAKTLKLSETMENRQALETGKLMHKALELFYQALPAEREKFWNDLTRIQALLRDKLALAFEQSVLRFETPYRRKVLFKAFERILLRFVAEEAELARQRTFTPTYFEYKFKDSSQEIPIEGQIDRIDVDAQGRALIVDYKLSERSEPIAKKIQKGLELQMPLYAIAVQNLLDLEVVGAEHRFLKQLKKDGFYKEAVKEELGLHVKKVYDEAAFEGILQTTKERVQKLVSRLKQGDIAVQSKSCDFCSFDPICRFEKWRLIYSENISDENT